MSGSVVSMLVLLCVMSDTHASSKSLCRGLSLLAWLLTCGEMGLHWAVFPGSVCMMYALVFPPKGKPIGLSNPDQRCYMNSLVQALWSCEKLLGKLSDGLLEMRSDSLDVLMEVEERAQSNPDTLTHDTLEMVKEHCENCDDFAGIPLPHLFLMLASSSMMKLRQHSAVLSLGLMRQQYHQGRQEDPQELFFANNALR